MRSKHGAVGFALLLTLLSSTSIAQTQGWRGNWTGLYPESTAPAQWQRIPNGVLAGLTCLASKPAQDAPGQPVEKGLVRQWLLIGPFDMPNPPADFAREQLAG